MKNEILYRDKKQFERKLHKLCLDGVEKLHILTDFDRTLAPCYNQYGKITSSFGQFREAGYLDEDYRQKAYNEFDKYHPIEVNPALPIEKKKPIMQEWWEKHLQLLIEKWLTHDIISQATHQRIFLRPGVVDFLTLTHLQSIPLLILSSGVGDSIRIYLEEHSLYFENVDILSNLFIFDEDGKVVDHQRPIIHVFNKDQSEVMKTQHWGKIQGRWNILLIGDSIGDVDMSEGFTHEEVIRIGFLNEDAEKRKDEFLEKFDIVLTWDGDFSYPYTLLLQITSSHA